MRLGWCVVLWLVCTGTCTYYTLFNLAQIGGEPHNISQEENNITAVDNRSDSATNRSSLVCHPDYVETCGLCLFSCKRSMDMPIWPGLRLPIDDIFQCFFFALTVLFTSTFILLAIVKRSEM